MDVFMHFDCLSVLYGAFIVCFLGDQRSPSSQQNLWLVITGFQEALWFSIPLSQAGLQASKLSPR